MANFGALVLSVQAARRDARSALPDAPVRPPDDRWRRIGAVLRRAVAPRS
jgi:hypothetical protein